MNIRLSRFFLLALLIAGVGCANQTTPPGGKKDITPPKLLKVSPSDSLRNTKAKQIELTFDEYITINDPIKEVQISPLLSIQPAVTGNNKKVILKIADSLLEENTTYRISFGSAIRDLHEGNIFPAYTYIFSTGSYFDSLQLNGKVITATTGIPDSGGTTVELYYATESDSAVVRHKPRYITRTDASGVFTFKGLPARSFKMFALKDSNDNLIYDGATEMIAFNDLLVTPGDTSAHINLKLFTMNDTSAGKSADSVKANVRQGRQNIKKTGFNYSVNVDTSNKANRTFDINKQIIISFSYSPALNKDKITLSYDSNGVAVPVRIIFKPDTLQPGKVTIVNSLLENTEYTLRMAKGFAKDTSGTDALPAKFTFRTREDEDYGKISVHLPAKYVAPEYLLMITTESDTVYQKPVTSAIVNLVKLRPAKYTFRIIADKNRNGIWDSGNLFEKRQPEEVIPYPDVLTLKAGWENIIDFEPKPATKKTNDRPGAGK